MNKPMKIEVVVRSIQDARPSGHKPSALFAGGINYKETIWCGHAEEHAKLFIKVFDLSAQLCGIEKGEFKPDIQFQRRFKQLCSDINKLHTYVVKLQNGGVRE